MAEPRPEDEAAALRRLLVLTAVALASSSLLLAGALSLEEKGRAICMLGLMFLLQFGHPILIEEDLSRRGKQDGGCFFLAVAFVVPPLGAALYLIAAYREKAAVLIPLYLGLLSAALGLGWGLGYLAGKS